MKKIISLFLSIVMLFSITAGFNISVNAATSGDYEYTILNDGTAKITKYNGMAERINIPYYINGYLVTQINGFDSNSNIKEIKVIK